MAEIILHVEDPGAANMAACIPGRLKELNRQAHLYASSHAKSVLTSRSKKFYEWDGNAKDLLALEKPKMIIVGTSGNKDSLSLRLTKESKRQLIPTVGLVDMSVNASNRFRGHTDNPLEYSTDHLIVADEDIQNEFIHLGYPSDRIVNLGNPAFQRAYSLRLRRDRYERQQHVKKKLLFVADGWDPFGQKIKKNTSEGTMIGRGGSAWRTEIVLEELIDALKFLELDVNIYVRPQPKMSPDDFSKYSDEVFFDESKNVFDTLAEVDAVVGMTSTLIAEAAAMGCPVLSIVTGSQETQFLYPLKHGHIPCATTRAELVEALPSIFSGELKASEVHEWASLCAEEDIAAFIAGLISRI
jgi:hypothetical protein